MSATGFRVRNLIAVSVLVLVGTLSGCAHNNPRDPLEPMNRGIYAFNDAVDSAVIKPIATGYKAVLPQFVRTGVSNFFSNLDDITVIINNILQLKIPQAASDTGRFLINTTVGVLGLIDVATHLGLEKHNEDFGQTLGYWGIGNGPYLVLPLLGPSTFRDGLGRWVDHFVDPILKEDHIRSRNQYIATRAVSNRAHLLDSEKVLDAAAIDRYSFLRDAYLQRRRNLVHDGNPPPEPDDDEINGKPLVKDTPAPAAILVDQFGNVVTSTYDTPSAKTTQPTTRSAPAVPADPAAHPAAAAPPAAAVAATLPVQATPAANGSAPNGSRIVRVWLSGSPAQ